MERKVELDAAADSAKQFQTDISTLQQFCDRCEKAVQMYVHFFGFLIEIFLYLPITPVPNLKNCVLSIHAKKILLESP